MTEQQYNVDLMLQIREQITAHPETHNQAIWAQETSCGTTLCVAGWAAQLSGEQLCWYAEDAADVRRAFSTASGVSIELYAENALGLSPSEASAMFYSSAANALERLDRLIEAGKNGERVPEGEL